MDLKKMFTRKEACELTGLTGTQVDYLCKQEFVVPEKIGSPRRPTVLYTWTQVMELKIISKLKERNVPSKYIYYFLEMLREVKSKELTSVLDSYILSVPVSEYNKDPNKYSFAKLVEPKGIILKLNNSDVDTDEDIKLLLTDREQLASWINDLLDDVNDLNHTFNLIRPLGDIEKEVIDAAEKYVPDWKERIPQVA